MKRVLPIISLLVLSSVPFMAHAEETRPIEVEASAATSYVFERQAAIVSSSPVANVTITWNQSSDFSGYVWAQAGDIDGREIDVGENLNHTFANGVAVRGEVAVYLYPDGAQTVYTASAGISVPMRGFTIDVDAQRYEGGFKSTLASVGVSHAVGPTTVTLGHAFNWDDDGTRLYPWYARFSVPLGHGDHAPTLGVRGFWGAGNGIVADLSYKF